MKSSNLNIIFVSTLLFYILGCAEGHCIRQNKDLVTENQQKIIAPEENPNMAKSERIKIYKYDGSLQCGLGKAVSATDMQKELKDIKVFSAENKSDGLMRIQLCGSPTGMANVYEIDKKDLDKAQSFGFKEWHFDREE